MLEGSDWDVTTAFLDSIGLSQPGTYSIIASDFSGDEIGDFNIHLEIESLSAPPSEDSPDPDVNDLLQGTSNGDFLDECASSFSERETIMETSVAEGVSDES